MIDNLLKYILWFLNGLDAQNDFDKNVVSLKLVK